MEKTLTERFKELIRVKSSSILDFSKRIDIAQTTLNSQLCSTRGISINVIMLTLNAFPDISAEWLLRGVGNMYKNVEASTDSEEEDSEEDKFYKDIIFTYQEMTKEYRKKIEYLEAELAKAAPFAGEEKKKQSKSA